MKKGDYLFERSNIMNEIISTQGSFGPFLDNSKDISSFGKKNYTLLGNTPITACLLVAQYWKQSPPPTYCALGIAFLFIMKQHLKVPWRCSPREQDVCEGNQIINIGFELPLDAS